MRPARRSERFPSLVRVDTINGRPAEEVAEGTRFEDSARGVAGRAHRARLGDDPTVNTIQWLTPFGKGSRVVIAGASRSGKSEALRRLAGALAASPSLEVSAVLAGVRPEEVADWPGRAERGPELRGLPGRAGAGRRAGGRDRPARRRARRGRRRADRRLRVPAGQRRAARPGRGPQPRGRRLADRDRHRRRRPSAARRPCRAGPRGRRARARSRRSRWATPACCAPSCSWARPASRRCAPPRRAASSSRPPRSREPAEVAAKPKPKAKAKPKPKPDAKAKAKPKAKPAVVVEPQPEIVAVPETPAAKAEAALAHGRQEAGRDDDGGEEARRGQAHGGEEAGRDDGRQEEAGRALAREEAGRRQLAVSARAAASGSRPRVSAAAPPAV